MVVKTLIINVEATYPVELGLFLIREGVNIKKVITSAKRLCFCLNFQDMSEKVKGRNDPILGVIRITIWI